MKLKEINESISLILKEHPEAEDWEVFVEVEDLYTIGQQFLKEHNYDEDMIAQNRKTTKRVKTETEMGWKFLKLKDCTAGKDDDAYEYYKECAGGIGIETKKKAITIHINY